MKIVEEKQQCPECHNRNIDASQKLESQCKNCFFKGKKWRFIHRVVTSL